MNIISARNSKGIQCIGVGESGAEAISSMLASAMRSSAEQCEQRDLGSWIIGFLPVEHLIDSPFSSESEFWRITAR
jgi:hypothetical protein